MNGIGPDDLAFKDFIGEPVALSLVISVPTPPAYLAKKAVSLALSIILSKLSSITFT